MRISFEIFDGKTKNIQALLSFYCKNNIDKRYVLSIDAISLKSYISVSKNGEVKGLKNTKFISKEEALKINSSKCFLNQKKMKSKIIYLQFTCVRSTLWKNHFLLF